MKPFVKWAGGKRQILENIMEYIKTASEDNRRERYIEPFLGGGAVFFHLCPQQAIINDLNEDLINAYRVIKSDNYVELIRKLKEHEQRYKEKERADADEYYYDIRSWDRNPDWPDNYDEIARAARMIFLNRTCYNGLYRVNFKGQFNTPIGRYTNPLICDEVNIREIHDYLKENDIKIMCGSYDKVLEQCREGDIIYIDPPYDYEDDDGFTKYQMSGFSFEDFKTLKQHCDDAVDRGSAVVISNNATEKVISLFTEDIRYKAYYLDNLKTLRTINCKGGERRTGSEVIIVGVSFSIVPQANDMEKVINLAKAGEKILTDVEYAKQVLGVSTQRQVAYYKSALQYFGYILSTKQFSSDFLKLEFNEEAIKKNIYEQLISKPEFKDFVDSEVTKEDIIKKITRLYSNYSSETITRRASTIENWLNWLKKYRELN